LISGCIHIQKRCTDWGGAMPKDEERPETIKTSVKLPRTLWKRARMQAIEDDTELQVIITKALEDYLRKRTGK